jgi:hypothetical protein
VVWFFSKLLKLLNQEDVMRKGPFRLVTNFLRDYRPAP